MIRFLWFCREVFPVLPSHLGSFSSLLSCSLHFHLLFISFMLTSHVSHLPSAHPVFICSRILNPVSSITRFWTPHFDSLLRLCCILILLIYYLFIYLCWYILLTLCVLVLFCCVFLRFYCDPFACSRTSLSYNSLETFFSFVKYHIFCRVSICK